MGDIDLGEIEFRADTEASGGARLDGEEEREGEAEGLDVEDEEE